MAHITSLAAGQYVFAGELARNICGPGKFLSVKIDQKGEIAKQESVVPKISDPLYDTEKTDVVLYHRNNMFAAINARKNGKPELLFVETTKDGKSVKNITPGPG